MSGELTNGALQKNRDRLITDNIEGKGDADNGGFGKH